MSKKFTLPDKLKTIPNSQEIINWYEDKLNIMEKRQKSLSRKISKICLYLKLEE